MQRARIYQLLPRLFGNTNETRKPDGTLQENGVGKFAGINDAALRSLRDELGITHLWLTGVLAQATATDYPAIGKPADHPGLCKGLAGSPYAIKDYGDVCPDYAIEPARRMEEFKALLDRAHALGLRVLIDFVANHVARSHRGTDSKSVRRAAIRAAETGQTANLRAFGEHDDPSQFFAPNNNFFWLQRASPGGGPPLRLPSTVGKASSPSPLETTPARVSGNNAVTWSPSPNDWYETAKLNYGYDFTTGHRAYPHRDAPDLSIPDTWTKMDAILAHWQAIGVDGFRCDMAHMVPPEFWAWAIAHARRRQPEAIFIAEAYDNDPMKVENGNVLTALLSAGFDAVYDDPAYKTLKRIYDGPAWANDLDGTLAAQGTHIFQVSLRYAENHDEVRLASKGNWGGIGMDVGRAVSGVLFGLSRGPVLLYSGQEVGEPASGAEGFGGDDGRTTIFDYWCMPEFAKWVNGHRYDGRRLSPRQKQLREFYGALLKLIGEPAFRDGDFLPLNPINIQNPSYGRLPGEPASGHWLYTFVRADTSSAGHFLVVVNLHATRTFENVRVEFTQAVMESFAAFRAARSLTLHDRLNSLPDINLPRGATALTIPGIPPLTPAYFQITPSN